MQPLHAVVKNGRLTLDAPSELPDGRVVLLVPLEDLMKAMDGEAGDDEGGVSFAIYPPAREWNEPRTVDAAAILDELRAL